MIEVTRERMSKAIEKAHKVRNHVRMVSWRRYEVRTPGNHVYTVTFETKAGKKLAGCTCLAGAKNQACYHIAAAVVLHLAIARMYAEQQKPKPRPSSPKRPAREILIKRDCNHEECKTSRCDKGQRIGGIEI